MLLIARAASSQNIPYPQFVNTGNPRQDSANYNKALIEYDVWKSSQIPKASVNRNASTNHKREKQVLRTGADCIIPRDNSWIPVPTNGDGFLGPINLGFTFTLYGKEYSQVWINTNGNLTFEAGYSPYTPTGFPFNVPMVAGFWADVDTRPACSGQIYYKLEATRLLATWENVGYFNQKCDKLNT